jgi:hypothetical protein
MPQTALIAQRPIFCVVLGDGDEWLIEAEWPDGTIAHICAFKAHSEAVNWVRARSEAWLQERV